MAKSILVTSTDLMMIQFLIPHIINLSKRGYIVDIACSNVGNKITDIKDILDNFVNHFYVVRLHRNPINVDNLNGYFDMKNIMNIGNYDIIWTNEPVMGVITRLAARKKRKKGSTVIYMAHGFHFYKGAPKKNWLLYYPIEKFMSRYTDKLITINHEDYELAKNKFNCDVYHVHGVGVNSNRCFILPKDETAQIKRTLGLDKDDKIILNVGELLPNKNQKTAILAMTKVVKIIPNSKLLIAGNGILKEELQELIDKHSLNDNVKLIGYTTEINKYMNICDLLVACSFREGLPLNLMEAMLCGKFIVASKNRGHNELITNGVNGYLFDPDNADELANLIINALNNTNINKDKILELVNPYIDKNVVDELANIYELEK